MKKVIIFVFLIIIGISIFAYFLWPNATVVSFNNLNDTGLVIEDKLIENDKPVIIENDNVLISLPIIKEYFDPNAYWDDEYNIIIFTFRDKVVKMKVDSNIAMVNGRPVEMDNPLRLYDDVPYVFIEFLSDEYNINVEYVEENDIAIIDIKNNYKKIAEAIDNKGDIRTSPNIKSPKLINDLEKGSVMEVFEEYENWYKVRNQDGIIGYIDKKHVKIIYDDIVTNQNAVENIETINAKNNEKITLLWDPIYNQKLKQNINGLDVISPTWFSIIDKKGTIKSKVNKEYVDWAHDNGYQVWALLDNSFDLEITNSILNDSIIRENIIQDMLYYLKSYEIDGINIDFENVYLEDKDMLTQFIRELVPIFRENGLIVSIDVTVKSSSENWSLFYDRKALGEVVDYMAVMAYDQHWASSPKAGSVAQYSWVESKLKEIIEEVPSEKILLGVPFYTRLWKVENVNGEEKVTSIAIGMERAYQIIEEKNVEISWDEESGQYYGEYSDGKAKYKIWLEDDESINLKSSLVHKYNLAGVAAWRKGFETEDIWDVLNTNLKVNRNYLQWARNNGYQDFNLEGWR